MSSVTITTTPPTYPRELLGAIVTLTGITVIPALAVAIPLLLWRGPTPAELIVGAVMYVVAGLGISIGWHRYYTHKGFTAGPVVRAVLAVSGSFALEGTLGTWVANHRAHHLYTDSDGDPHSPWTERGMFRGFVHAHVGWLTRVGADRTRWARDIENDPTIGRISRHGYLIAALGAVVPAITAAALGDIRDGIGMLCWAGLARIALFHHVTWSVNSICHMYGKRPNGTRDRSTNFAPLAILSFGESWHNNHHHSPKAARHGWEAHQVDISARVIRGAERLGIVRDVHWGGHQR
jgi:stearoyl-CoA desaturase (delta-9 desaturase)